MDVLKGPFSEVEDYAELTDILMLVSFLDRSSRNKNCETFTDVELWYKWKWQLCQKKDEVYIPGDT
jgi:hypothetical protein